MATEFSQFSDLMKSLGIKTEMYWQLPKEPWQERLNAQGYNITALATFAKIIGPLYYVFSSGQPHWTICPKDSTSDEVHEQGHGPHGCLLMIWDDSKKQCIPRVNIKFGDGSQIGTSTGLEALAKDKGFHPVPQSKPIVGKYVAELVNGERYQIECMVNTLTKTFYQFAGPRPPQTLIAQEYVVVKPHDAELNASMGYTYLDTANTDTKGDKNHDYL